MSLPFTRAGRAWHLDLTDEAGLEAVLALDEALWIATSAPRDALWADAGLLRVLDVDGDGRISLRDIRASITHLLERLGSRAGVRPWNDRLEIAALAPSAAAERAAAGLVRARQPGAAGVVSLAEVRAVLAAETATGLATADRVHPEATEDPAVAAYLAHARDVTGGSPDRAGAPAVAAADLDRFHAALDAWAAWTAARDPGAWPCGDDTPAAEAALAAVEGAFADWFVLCAGAAVDPGLPGRVWPKWSADAGTPAVDAAAVQAALEAAPLALPTATGAWVAGAGDNPQWAARLARFEEAVRRPRGSAGTPLTSAEFAAIQADFAAYRAWVAARPADPTAGRDPAQVAAHRAGDALRAAAGALLARSAEVAAAVDGLVALERILLLQGGLLPVCRSFVSAPDLFAARPARTGKRPDFPMAPPENDLRPLFIAGELVADGRRFALTVRVPDHARSAQFAPQAYAFLVYAEVGETAAAWEYEVVAAVTAGERGTLVEGAWCAFVDRAGVQKLARITAVVQNPISVRESLWSPVYRGMAALEELVAKRGEAAQAAAAVGTTALATQTAGAALDRAAAPPAPGAAPAAPAPAPPASPPKDGAFSPAVLTAMLTGGAVGFAALGSAFAMVAGFLAGLTPLGVVLAALGLLGAFVLPVGLLAWLKLRRRDVAALLEGSGWGMNHRLRVELPRADLFTWTPPLPPGAARRGRDTGDGPFGRMLVFGFGLAVLLAVGWALRAPIARALGWDPAVLWPDPPPAAPAPAPAPPA